MMSERFFLNLSGFNNGIVLSDQDKFDFLNYEDGSFFESSTYTGEDMSGFQKIREEYDQPACTCTEFNLRNLFEKNPKEKIIVNHKTAISNDKIELLFSWYNDGYQRAIAMPIHTEIGSIYDSLEIEKKIELLSLFSKYCIKHSFFEGFATKNCLYAIGYIQAFLLKAQRELSSIKYIGLDNEENTAEPLSKLRGKASPILKSDSGLIKVADESAMSEIYIVWSILIKESNEFGSPINTGEELNFLLGHLFYCQDFKLAPKKSFDFNLFGAAHRDLLDFLIRLSKKINNDKLNNEAYCTPLKHTFKVVYKNVDSVETLSKNWANNNKKVMRRITNKIDHESEIYQTIVRAIRKGNLEHLLTRLI